MKSPHEYMTIDIDKRRTIAVVLNKVAIPQLVVKCFSSHHSLPDVDFAVAAIVDLHYDEINSYLAYHAFQ